MSATGINGARDTTQNHGQGDLQMKLRPLRQRVLGKEGIECSRKPIRCTLDDSRIGKVERETGVVIPGTKRHVEFVYRLAKPV